MIVYVVGFTPAATGGLDWYPEAGEAVDRLRELLHDLPTDSHALTFFPLDVPDHRYFRPGTREVDREGVTSWIDAHLELVEVGVPPAVPGERPPRCVIYGCGEDAVDKMEFALPGGATGFAPVCEGHREALATGEEVLGALREGVGLGRALEQTRPSAVVRRPDPEAPISETTVAELLTEALERAKAARDAEMGFVDAHIASPRRSGKTLTAARVRELSIFVTLVEDAITRHNKAVYMGRGVFAITDAERVPE